MIWLLKYLEEEDYASAIALVNDHNSSMTDRKKMLLDYENGNLAAAEQKLQALPDAREEDSRFKQYYEIMLDLKASNHKVQDISEVQENVLLDIANSPTKTAYRAQALLYAAKGIEFPVLLPDFEGNAFYTTFKADASQFDKVRFFPNITKNLSYLNYRFGDDEKVDLRVYNLNGEIITSAILTGKGTYALNVTQLKPGIYFYTISQPDGTVFREKIVVIK